MPGKIDFTGKGSMDAGPMRNTQMPTGKVSGAKAPIQMTGKGSIDADSGAKTSMPNSAVPGKGDIQFTGMGQKDLNN